MLSIPPAWSKAHEDQHRFFERIASAPRSVLISDYDGTLAPFQNDKMQAFPYKGLEARLSKMLALSNIRLVFVTGRPAGELRELLSLTEGMEIWGSHGREHIDSEGRYSIFPPTDMQTETLALVHSALSERGYGQALERKPASLAVHWRTAAPQEKQQIEAATRSIAEQYLKDDCFETMPFEEGIEVRITGRTKADAVRTVLDAEPHDAVAAYLGDDRTDEDAFPAMKGRGISVLVRPQVRESLADFWMNPPLDLIDFFDHWISSARSRS